MKRSLFAAISLLALLIPGMGAANSVPSEVQLDSQALFTIEFDPIASQINVQAQVQCAGVATLRVDVTQQAPPATGPAPATGTGELTFTCAKTSQRVAVTVSGDCCFQPGDALAVATLTAVENGYLTKPDQAVDKRIISIRYR